MRTPIVLTFPQALDEIQNLFRNLRDALKSTYPCERKTSRLEPLWSKNKTHWCNNSGCTNIRILWNPEECSYSFSDFYESKRSEGSMKEKKIGEIWENSTSIWTNFLHRNSRWRGRTIEIPWNFLHGKSIEFYEVAVIVR